MLSETEKEFALRKFRELELEVHNTSVVDKLATNDHERELLASTDPIAPILRTALVINWPEKAMRERYEAFRKKFPEIQTLSQLKSAIEETDPLKFCRSYLGINANPDKPQDNPKYALLKTLTDGFLKYKHEHGCATEMEAIRHWALNAPDYPQLIRHRHTRHGRPPTR